MLGKGETIIIETGNILISKWELQDARSILLKADEASHAPEAKDLYETRGWF